MFQHTDGTERLNLCVALIEGLRPSQIQSDSTAAKNGTSNAARQAEHLTTEEQERTMERNLRMENNVAIGNKNQKMSRKQTRLQGNRITTNWENEEEEMQEPGPKKAKEWKGTEIAELQIQPGKQMEKTPYAKKKKTHTKQNGTQVE